MSRYGDDPIDFGPADDAYRSYDMRGEETARGPLILALAAGVLIVFGAVVWNTYRQGVRTDTGQLPLITAEADPYKRLPDEAGGQRAPDQELRFYDEIDGSSRMEPVSADRLRRSVSASPAEVLAGGASPDSVPAPATGDAFDAGRDVAPTTSQSIGLPRRSALDGSGARIAVLDEATMALAAQQAAQADALMVPKPLGPSPAGPLFNFSASGPYMVQIAALRDHSRAEATWEMLTTRHPDIFAGSEKRIQRADLGARGVFFRLRAGAFDARSDASAFCDAIKSSGNDCIVVQ
ncbi:MAG: SPOR domain-containing protein [Pseudomonadota bacterium]